MNRLLYMKGSQWIENTPFLIYLRWFWSLVIMFIFCSMRKKLGMRKIHTKKVQVNVPEKASLLTFSLTLTLFHNTLSLTFSKKNIRKNKNVYKK